MDDLEKLEAELRKFGQDELRRRLALELFNERKAAVARHILDQAERVNRDRISWATLIASVVAAVAVLIAAFR